MRDEPLVLYDKWLLFAAISLLILGLMMVASSSVMISTKYFLRMIMIFNSYCYTIL